jgi:L-aminopeptidase/D-esterase-like protein
MRRSLSALVLLLFTAAACVAAAAGDKPRARDLGVPFEGNTGTYNAITDVPGVLVGYTTLISGNGKREVGSGPVRTGVTAVLPRGRDFRDAVFAGWFALNGNGEMTGTAWIDESGFLEGPIMITNTYSVGVVRDAVIAWQFDHDNHPESWGLPVVAETHDGDLNDISGLHVKPEHAFRAIDTATSGSIAEGNVGGGTGMVSYEFKGGTGTSSRRLGDSAGGHTVGVLVQANHGRRYQLQIAGVPVGREITEHSRQAEGAAMFGDAGSIIIVVATDAPLLPHQLKRLARRAALGLARTGAMGYNGSGDIFIAFSTANPGAQEPAAGYATLTALRNDAMDPLIYATVLATEEAIVNALVAAETMTGADDRTVHALPHDRLRAVLKKYNRLQ